MYFIRKYSIIHYDLVLMRSAHHAYHRKCYSKNIMLAVFTGVKHNVVILDIILSRHLIGPCYQYTAFDWLSTNAMATWSLKRNKLQPCHWWMNTIVTAKAIIFVVDIIKEAFPFYIQVGLHLWSACLHTLTFERNWLNSQHFKTSLVWKPF